MAKIKICKEKNCYNSATTAGYCRLHYLKNSRKIKEEQRQKAGKRLDAYIESICKKHPDNYIEVIKENISSPGFEGYVEDRFGYDDEDILQVMDDL